MWIRDTAATHFVGEFCGHGDAAPAGRERNGSSVCYAARLGIFGMDKQEGIIAARKAVYIVHPAVDRFQPAQIYEPQRLGIAPGCGTQARDFP